MAFFKLAKGPLWSPLTCLQTTIYNKVKPSHKNDCKNVKIFDRIATMLTIYNWFADSTDGKFKTNKYQHGVEDYRNQFSAIEYVEKSNQEEKILDT